MSQTLNIKKFSLLVYGIRTTGLSINRYFKKRKIRDFYVWDDNIKLRKKFGFKKVKNLYDTLKKVDYIILSPGISLKNTKHKKDLNRYSCFNSLEHCRFLWLSSR